MSLGPISDLKKAPAEEEGAGSVCVCFCTFPSAEIAERIVRTLVEEQRIACGNLVPAVKSIYRWQGKVEEANEVLSILKTRTSTAASLATRLKELHPYDTPELIVLPVEAGLPAYLQWVLSSVRP